MHFIEGSIIFETAHDRNYNIYNKTSATSKDSDQTAHSRSLIRVFADRMCFLQPPGYSKRGKRGINENACHTGWMYMLIWVFAEYTGLIVRVQFLYFGTTKLVLVILENRFLPSMWLEDVSSVAFYVSVHKCNCVFYFWSILSFLAFKRFHCTEHISFSPLAGRKVSHSTLPLQNTFWAFVKEDIWSALGWKASAVS